MPRHPLPLSGVANEPEVLGPPTPPRSLFSAVPHGSLLRPSFLLASVGGALTSDLPLPARLTDDSTPSHMQTRARLDTLPRRDIDVHVPRGTRPRPIGTSPREFRRIECSTSETVLLRMDLQGCGSNFSFDGVSDRQRILCC